MQRIRTILVATDGSEDARHAEIRATRLGAELKAEMLEMMTVEETKTGAGTVAASVGKPALCTNTIVSLMERRESVSKLTRAQAQASPPSRPRFIQSVSYGAPAVAITDRASEMNADLVVVAAGGKTFAADLNMRNSNNEIVRISKRPVLLARMEPTDIYRKVLIAVDFSEESKEAARVALGIAPSAHLTFLHVFQASGEGMLRGVGVSSDTILSYRARAADTARHALNEFVADLGAGGRPISRVIELGQPASVIGEYAQREGIELIAMGKHGRSCVEEFLLGNVTGHLIDHAACDLLIAPMPQEDDWDDLPAA